MSPQPRPLSWVDRPSAELLRLAWPIAVSTLSYSAMTLVDTVFVGRLGTAALAGVGLGGVAAFSFVCFSIGLLRGVKTLVAQAVGAGREHEIEGFVAAGLVVAAGLGAVTTAAGLIAAPLVAQLAASVEAGDHAAAYLRIRLLGAPLLFAYVALRETRYGRGDARTPMVASVAGNLVNIGLDYLLIFGAGLGVAGAAWATVIGQVVEAAFLVSVQRRSGRLTLAGARGNLAALWRIGLPTGVQFVLEVGSFALLTAMIARFSEVDGAAHQIILQVVHFSFLPAFAVAEAASVLAGQAVGARRPALVGEVARRALALAGAYTGSCTVAAVVAPGAIVGLFDAEPALVGTATTLLRLSAVFLIADAANVVARGVLRGAGDVRVPAVIGIATAWALTPPLTYLLGERLGLGALGGWLGLCAEIFAGAAFLWWRLGSGAWQPAAERTLADRVGGDRPQAVAA